MLNSYIFETVKVVHVINGLILDILKLLKDINRNGAGMKWPPAHKVYEQLHEKHSRIMKKRLPITSLRYSIAKYTL